MENRSRIVNHSGVLERIRRFMLRVNDPGKVATVSLRYAIDVTILTYTATTETLCAFQRNVKYSSPKRIELSFPLIEHTAPPILVSETFQHISNQVNSTRGNLKIFKIAKCVY